MVNETPRDWGVTVYDTVNTTTMVVLFFIVIHDILNML